MKYVHTNIICKNIETLSKFYIEVFECKQVGSETKLIGEWVEKGTGVKNAEIRSIVLQLPGYENDGPKLEIFQYSEVVNDAPEPSANRKGFGHLAFSVNNVEETLNIALQNNGKKIGELVTKEFKKGTFTYVYITDPEGNIIEIQNWTPHS